MFGFLLLIVLLWVPVVVLGGRLGSGIWAGRFRILGTTYIRANEPLVYWIATTLCFGLFLLVLFAALGFSTVIFIPSPYGRHAG
jgi:hypothetical protein